MEEVQELIFPSDKELRQLEVLIEQQRLHITAVHPSRQPPEHRALLRMQGEHACLQESLARLRRRRTAA